MNLPPRPGDLVDLDRERCIELLGSAEIVRIAFVTERGPTVLPVNHLLHGDALYFRTAPGSKLGTAAADQPVAVEADGGEPATRTGWSVVVHGHASIVTDEAVTTALYDEPFEPWALPGDRTFWVRVGLDDVSGRAIVRGDRPRPASS